VSARRTFVVRGGPYGTMYLGGVRYDGGPWWRLWVSSARRYAVRVEADSAATWSGGRVEELA
jgi:hypothetical protein